MTKLTQQRCKPCEGGVAPYTLDFAQKKLKEIPLWKILEDGKKIMRQFTFKDFTSALTFVNSVGTITEKENHHPDIHLHDYKKVTFTLSTHAIGGLSENDFIVAAKINAHN